MRDPLTPGEAAANCIKMAVCAVGVVLLFVAEGVPEQLRLTRSIESGDAPFDPALVIRGEFYAFFLFSLTGVMLVAGATDLVWLFLALELVSLPTYVMVSTASDRVEAQEAGVKYFFLGAMAAAVFLYGFTLIYGATGSTELRLHHAHRAASQVLSRPRRSPLLITGIVLAITGIAFKIAAVPMHFYVADVYQGAPTPVTAFLAFVPKTAGFVALMLILNLFPGDLPPAIRWLIWVMAALTMTVGNVLGLLQSNVKRVLAYSSVAHSGYMLVGLLALRPMSENAIGNGHAAVLFYLIAYGLSTVGAFAVLGCLQARGEEVEELRRHLRPRPAATPPSPRSCSSASSPSSASPRWSASSARSTSSAPPSPTRKTTPNTSGSSSSPSSTAQSRRPTSASPVHASSATPPNPETPGYVESLPIPARRIGGCGGAPPRSSSASRAAAALVNAARMATSEGEPPVVAEKSPVRRAPGAAASSLSDRVAKAAR